MLNLVQRPNYKSFQHDYYCICGYKYKIRQIFNLISIIFSKSKAIKITNLKDEHKFALENLKNLTKNKFETFCMKCENFVEKKETVKKLAILNFDTLINFNDPNFKYTELKLSSYKFYHHLCFLCLVEEIENRGLQKENTCELAKNRRFLQKFFLKNNKLECKICDDIHVVSVDIDIREDKDENICSIF